MKKIYFLWLVLVLACLAGTAQAQQEATITGLVQTDATQPLPGATVFLKGTFVGTSTDRDGKFSLATTGGEAQTVLSVSFVGYETQEITVSGGATNVTVTLVPAVAFTNEVVVAASRVEEGILQAPVTVEKLNSVQIERITTADLQAGLSQYKGIDVSSSSLTLTSISTRGFNSAKSERLIQLTDYFDTQSPSLNVNAGNLTGVPELDIESIEIIHGPASALYGANAFNGVLLMNTKDPFSSEGLSVRLRGGQRSYLDGQLRYAKKLGEKFAFKLVGSYLTADDWMAENFSAQSTRITPRNNTEGSSLGYDAVNRYGDIGGYTFPAAFPITELRGKTIFMPGFDEKTLVQDDNKAKSWKVQPTISYLLNSNLKMTVGASVTRGTTTYQSASRYRLRNLGTNQYHGELKGTNWFLRGQSVQDFGADSYDLTFLGAFLQTATISPDGTGPTYAQRYYNTYLTKLLTTGDLAQAKQAADETQLKPSDPRFQELRSRIINDPTPGVGAKLSPSSLLNEGNAQYNFKFGDMTDLIVGGAYRKFRLGSNGNFFSDDNERIQNHELGGYTQLTHKMLDERLKLAAAVRVDDFKNFDPAVSPRASVVYSAGERKQHNFRASYGRAFRSPTQLDQYVRIDIGQVLLLGNVGNGFAGYSLTNGAGQPFGTPGADLNSYAFNAAALKLERLNTFEVGYKGILIDKLYMDVNYYRSQYNDFIGAVRFIGNRDGSRPTSDQLNTEFNRTQQSPPGTPFQERSSNTRVLQVWTNARQEVKTQGAALGLTYYFNKAFNLTGNYSLNILDDKDLPNNFQTFFNTPKHKYNLGVNGVVATNLNYAVNYRWAQGHLYEMAFAEGQLEDYRSLDAYVGYRLNKVGTTLQAGGSNLLDQQNTQVYGGPNIGRLVFMGLLIDLK